MDRERSTAVKHLVSLARDDRRVLAVLLFGSRARGDATAASDVDLCLVLDRRHGDPRSPSEMRLEYLTQSDLDVQVFQELPLFLRCRVLKEGEILFCRDEEKLYDVAFETARRFEDFRHIHDEYLEAVAGG